MDGARKTIGPRTFRRVAFATLATAILCLPSVGLSAQRQNSEPRYAPPPSRQSRRQPTRPQNPRQQNQNRSGQQSQPYRQAAPGQIQRPAPGPYGVPGGNRGVYPNPTYNTPGYAGRPAYPGTAQQLYAPPGHLGAWLNNHRNLPVQDQERMLRTDPSFNRLPQGEQQRVVNQLQQVNRLPNAQLERRLARAENLERLSPEQRAQVAQSTRRYATLAPDRRAMVSNAFRDLRAVPPDQRSIVLGSSRYQGQFSPEERGILSNMLRVEPYAPPQ